MSLAASVLAGSLACQAHWRVLAALHRPPPPRAAKNGCTECACEDGCQPREFTECECAFHARADERLLNRVVRRAVATPNFMASFRQGTVQAGPCCWVLSLLASSS